MKILHFCLSSFYIDNFSYQENILTRQNQMDGHDVKIIASTETYDREGHLYYVQPSEYLNEDDIPVTRLPYKKFLPHAVMKKLRMHSGVYELIEKYKPDVMFFHSLCGWELLIVARYKRNNPHVKFFADSHEDFNNSARSFVSRYFLHGLYYRFILFRSLPLIDRIFYISLETREFIKRVYKIPDDHLEFFPLGGHVFSDREYFESRNRIRSLLGVSKDDILFLQAGKMGSKKKVLESMDAFQANRSEKFRFVLIGSVDDEISSSFEKGVEKDNRISYLGWKQASELMEYLCAADVYLQPGSQSAIMQNAICLRCAVVLDDVLSHKPFVNGNGWLINNKTSLSDILKEISLHTEQLALMAKKSLEIGEKMLDYTILAKKMYS